MQYRIWHKEFKRYLDKSEWLIKGDGTVVFYDMVQGLIPCPKNLVVVEMATDFKDVTGKQIYSGDTVQFTYTVGDFAWEFLSPEETAEVEKLVGQVFTGVILPNVAIASQLEIHVPHTVGTAIYNISALAGGSPKIIQ